MRELDCVVEEVEEEKYSAKIMIKIHYSICANTQSKANKQRLAWLGVHGE